MSRVCGDCGYILQVVKNGALLFSVDLKKYRETTAYGCRKCDKIVLTNYSTWLDVPIEKIDLKPRYNVSLSYDHSTSVEDKPVCVDCSKTMD